MVYKLAWVENKLAWAEKSHPALILEVSTINVRGYYVSRVFLGLTAPVLEISRAFYCLD